MAFKKITSGSKDAYVSFGDTVQFVLPSVGVVKLTKDSFVKLLKYFKSYDFILGKQELDNTYYPKSSKKLGYFVEDADGSLIIIDLELTKSGKTCNVLFHTLDTNTANVIKETRIPYDVMDRIISEAAAAGITSGVKKEYVGIKFVDALPAETAAQRNTVYFFEKKYYTLNEAEDALDEIQIVQKEQLPATKIAGEENVLYNLLHVDEEPALGLTFKQGVYTFTAVSNTFTLQDMTIQRTSSLPDVAKASATTVYVLTKDEKVSESETRKAGTAYAVKNGRYVEETRKIRNCNRLPVADLGKANTYYAVAGMVYKFAAGSDSTLTVNKIGKIVKIKVGSTLPNVSTIRVDPDYIYTLTKVDGERAIGSRWVFNMDTKAFEAYVNPLDEKASGSATTQPGAATTHPGA